MSFQLGYVKFLNDYGHGCAKAFFNTDLINSNLFTT